MCVSLTTQWWAPPLQDDSSLSALTGIGLQCVTQTLITIGPAGTEVIHTGSIPRFRRHHAMAGLKDSWLQDLTASVSPLLGLVARIFTGIDIFTGTTGWEAVATIWDLKWQMLFDLCAVRGLVIVWKFNFCLSMYLIYPPAVAKVRLWLADLSAGHSEVILVVVVEVSTKTTGVSLIGAWHTHFQMWTTTPQYLKVDQWVYECVT